MRESNVRRRAGERGNGGRGMKDLIQYDFNGRNIRTIIGENGEPWWVVKDVCEVFGDSHYLRSVSRLDEDEKGMTRIDTPGGLQNMMIVDESGLYSLLFLMQPQQGNISGKMRDQRIDYLKRFKRWITHEVLPSIRKTGSYSLDPPELLISKSVTRKPIDSALMEPILICGITRPLTNVSSFGNLPLTNKPSVMSLNSIGIPIGSSYSCCHRITGVSFCMDSEKVPGITMSSTKSKSLVVASPSNMKNLLSSTSSIAFVISKATSILSQPDLVFKLTSCSCLLQIL